MRTPPPGVALTSDVMRRNSGYVARVRWFDPDSRVRRSRSLTCQTEDQVAAFFERMRAAVATGIDPGITLGDYVASLGGRWMRGIDGTSTADPYRAGLSKRIVPALGHLPVRLITAGLVDRTIDGWEADCGSSTLKNTVAALVRVLDEARPRRADPDQPRPQSITSRVEQGSRPNGESSVAGARRPAHAHAAGRGGERSRSCLRDVGHAVRPAVRARLRGQRADGG